VRAWESWGVLVLIGAATVGACGGDAGGRAAGWSATVDTLASGAVRVVNVPPASGIRPTWVLQEELRIGALDAVGPETFGQIKGLAAGDDGRIFVLDAQAQELRVFGPDGGHVATMARRGEGPGELGGANGIMRAPDGRIWVVDPQLARMSVFDPETGFATSHRWDMRGWGFVWEGTFDARGRVLEPSSGQVDGAGWLMLRVYDQAMTPLDSVPLRALPPMRTEQPGSFMVEYGAGGWGLIGVPFYPRSQSVLDPSFAYWSSGDGDASYRFVRWVPGGDTTLVVESRRPAVPVTAAERDSAITRIRDMVAQRGVDARLDWSRIPDTRPAIAGLFLAEGGDVWVRVNTAERDLTTWDVFAPDGRYAGTALAPFRAHSWVRPVVRGDRYWAVRVDDLDVEYVSAGRVRPADPDEAG
jgi:hypothetical protein